MYRLLFQGRDAGRTPFIGRKPQIAIGRGAGCELQLAEDGVSDQHAVVERRTEGYYLRDLGSANGVRVNGQLVAEQRLATEDEIEIGSVRLRFEVVHEPPPERRTLDALELTASVVVTLVIAGQIALVAWVFSTPRPVRGTPIETGKNPVQSPAAAQAPSQAVGNPGVPMATTLSPPAPKAAAADALPVSEVLNRMLKIQRVDRVDGADNVTLRIQVKAQVGERQLDNSTAAVCVQFFTVGSGASGAPVPQKPVWLTAPPGWENFATKSVTARFVGSPRQCAGYVVRTYYRKQLQDAVATPPALLNVAPTPAS
ncbi:MAG TPA: FHA domain-containing protein [Verrucomicrobiae bacterium]|nr:FHA domain-containing protein [Verrucomicrobiae bacterium]